MVTKKVVNKTTFTQKMEWKTLTWNCRKDNFHIKIERYGLSWYILAHRKKDDTYWNSLWTKKVFSTIEDAMDFGSKFNFQTIKNSEPL
jgi:hypothetical protein